MRLAILGDSPCGQCTAQCCKQTVTEFAILLQGDDERRRFAPWAMTDRFVDDAGRETVERVIPYADGRCPFLGDDDRCTIYEDRPLGCRQFECVRHYNQHGVGRHGYFVANNAQVREMLDQL